MSDHNIERLRSTLAQLQEQRFSPGFVDRVMKQIRVEDSAGAQFFAQLWPQFRRLALGAVVASLVMGVYVWSGRPVAPSLTLEQIYRLEGFSP